MDSFFLWDCQNCLSSSKILLESVDYINMANKLAHQCPSNCSAWMRDVIHVHLDGSACTFQVRVSYCQWIQTFWAMSIGIFILRWLYPATLLWVPFKFWFICLSSLVLISYSLSNLLSYNVVSHVHLYTRRS